MPGAIEQVHALLQIGHGDRTMVQFEARGGQFATAIGTHLHAVHLQGVRHRRTIHPQRSGAHAGLSRQFPQLWTQAIGRLVSLVHQPGHGLLQKAPRGIGRVVGQDQHIAQVPLALGVLQRGEHGALRQDVHRAVQLIGWQQTVADIDPDHQVGSHGACVAHREVADLTSIHQQEAVGEHGREKGGDGHARTHGVRQEPPVLDQGLSRPHVRGDAGEGDGEFTEIVGPVKGQRMQTDQLHDLLPANEPGRQLRAMVPGQLR